MLTAADIRAFRSDAMLKEALRRSLVRMLAFYGFRLIEQDGPCLEHTDKWDRRAGVWLRRHNHNYLRLTRIMKSLTLLGLPDEARALYEALLRESALVEPDVIGRTTLQYWKNAAG